MPRTGSEVHHGVWAGIEESAVYDRFADSYSISFFFLYRVMVKIKGIERMHTNEL